MQTYEKKAVDITNEELMAVQTELEIFFMMQPNLTKQGENQNSKESFKMEIPIETNEALISNCVAGDPQAIC